MAGHRTGGILKYDNSDLLRQMKARYESLKNCETTEEATEMLIFSRRSLKIKKVLYSGPATIVFWNDGTKTVCKCHDMDTFDAEVGLAMAIAKKYFGTYPKLKRVAEEGLKISYGNLD